MQALIDSLNRATTYNQNFQVAPVAILWTDKKEEWLPLAPLLRSQLPNFLTYGDYDPSNLTGPAIWLKCMVARTLPEATWDDGVVPILYLPGVSRQELRAVETCPWLLQPLLELQFRGTYWTQSNTRDWTVFAFLKSKEGLGLDVAQDANTLQAMQDVLPTLADTRVIDLSGKRLEAADFNKLVMQDSDRELLLWLNDPQGTQNQWDKTRWSVFCNSAKEVYKFDPKKDGAITAADLLSKRKQAWATVWDRFAEAPQRYRNIPQLLEQVAPQNLSLFSEELSSYPQYNAAQEQDLRTEFLKFSNLSPQEAYNQVGVLEQQHGKRRQWVWATLGQAPLAQALEHLAALAPSTKSMLGGSTPLAMAEQYIEHGWQADAAMLKAIACVQKETDVQAIAATIQALYTPWLERSAEHLQSLLQSHPYPNSVSTMAEPLEIANGECLLFADGLRFDIGQWLKNLLQDNSWNIETGWQWVALPSVTATSKPSVSPIASQLSGTATGEKFCPTITASGQELTSDRFQKLLQEQEIQILEGQDTGDPKGKAWTEFGDIDHYGHQQGYKLAHHIPQQLSSLALRIKDLLNAGWQRVRVVTDHGWLLLPGGLPKQAIPAHLTQTRWGRCAALKDTAQTNIATVPWFWSEDVRIATATNICCFKAGLEYAHGGISLQECITPVLTVSGTAPTYSASISGLKWLGLRCRVTVSNASEGMKVDIRRKLADPSTSLANGGKAIANGTASLAIEDDRSEGEPALIVLLDPQGTAIAKQSTIVGGDA